MKSMTRRSFIGAASAATLMTLTSLAGLSATNADGIGLGRTSSAFGHESSEIQIGTTAVRAGAQKLLVVYFSCTKTTERVAKIISNELDATLYQIEAQDPYTDADLAYYTNCRADREQGDPSVRPAIAGNLPDMSAYDTMVIGYPIWHGQAPHIISTFLESCDLSGKTILPFCTSHSSGIGLSAESLHGLCPDALWLPGQRFGADSSAGEIADWLSSVGVVQSAAHTTTATNPGAFSIANQQVTLNNGLTMPTNGLGTYSLHGQTCVDAVTAALHSGVRLIDTAHIYGNEAEVGHAVRQFGIAREEVFVITKLYPSQFADADTAIEEALGKMDLGYIDMMLLHHPGTGDVEAYRAIERAIDAGLVRAAGLSCYYINELTAFLSQVTVKPALVQNEIHPYYQDTDVVSFIHQNGIAVQAWYPLGGRGHNEELLADPVLTRIAQTNGVSVPQVILRWDLQRGVIVIPGSSSPNHIREDATIYGFELTEEEMAQIASLNRNEKHDWY